MGFDFSELALLELEAEMDFFEDYLGTMEDFLGAETQEHIEEIEALRARRPAMNLGDGPSPQEDYARFSLELIDRFTNLLRGSFFASLYSSFESQLVKECRSRKSDDILLTYSDVAGHNEIDKAKIYFTKVLRDPFPSDSPEWSEIQNYRLLRNCIVHSQGKIDDMKDQRDQKVLREYIGRKQTLSLRGEEVIFGRDFGEEAVKTVNTCSVARLS